ncbi:hypothetical protein [Mameliella alba]|uniref:Uncharacterized protein n=1 Tax=Mameliella alba TaxID=561184 RepID=A0A0B3ST05_9RHOB|nr:hypothetical protein [Mameliella alba]KHQ53599.1 hypothetical protein OA50_01586 [Mameliella alba]
MPNPYPHVTLVSPGGVLTKPFADGTHLTMRVTLGYLFGDEGVLTEMRERREPVPWENQRVRDEALEAIRTRIDVEDDIRADLLAWVEGTPFYQ